jgi:type VI secretion system protein ImpB
MAKEGSVAPKERVNITYKSAGDAKEEVELPFKILALGDYTGRADDRPLEDRKAININKENFNEVMAEHKLSMNANVGDKLSEGGGEMSVNLKFSSLRDFEPESIANQVPELRQLVDLRNALNALRGPLGNVPAFRKKLQAMLGDDASREKLMQELGLNKGE